MNNVIFWGTRGSLPVALTADDVRQKIIAVLQAANGMKFRSPQALLEFIAAQPFAITGTYGGDTSCVEIVSGGAEHIICDMGSGARPLGHAKIAAYGYPQPQVYHLFLSHLHWDHLMGFPFFAPLYIPGNRIVVHGCHSCLEEGVRQQMKSPYFPVEFSKVSATVEFDEMTPGQPRTVAGLSVTPYRQLHTGESYGYRFEGGGKIVAYSTDSEHKGENSEERQHFVSFFRDADLVIFDAMYSLADAVSIKADFGHSSNIVGVELCQAAGAKRLALFHHEPVNDDAQLSRLFEQTRRFEEISRPESAPPLQILSAYDGLSVTL